MCLVDDALHFIWRPELYSDTMKLWTRCCGSTINMLLSLLLSMLFLQLLRCDSPKNTSHKIKSSLAIQNTNVELCTPQNCLEQSRWPNWYYHCCSYCQPESNHLLTWVCSLAWVHSLTWVCSLAWVHPLKSFRFGIIRKFCAWKTIPKTILKVPKPNMGQCKTIRNCSFPHSIIEISNNSHLKTIKIWKNIQKSLEMNRKKFPINWIMKKPSLQFNDAVFKRMQQANPCERF